MTEPVAPLTLPVDLVVCVTKTGPHPSFKEMLKRWPDGPPPEMRSMYDDFDGGTQTKLDFDNGYGASIIFGSMFYSNGVDTFELGITHDGKLTYDSGLSDDVIGHLSNDEVTALLYKIKALKEVET